MIAKDLGGGFGDFVKVDAELALVLAEALCRRVRQARQAGARSRSSQAASVKEHGLGQVHNKTRKRLKTLVLQPQILFRRSS